MRWRWPWRSYAAGVAAERDRILAEAETVAWAFAFEAANLAARAKANGQTIMPPQLAAARATAIQFSQFAHWLRWGRLPEREKPESMRLVEVVR